MQGDTIFDCVWDFVLSESLARAIASETGNTPVEVNTAISRLWNDNSSPSGTCLQDACYTLCENAVCNALQGCVSGVKRLPTDILRLVIARLGSNTDLLGYRTGVTGKISMSRDYKMAKQRLLAEVSQELQIPDQSVPRIGGYPAGWFL